MKIVQEVSGVDMIVKRGIWNKCVSSFHWHENIEIVRPLNKNMKFLVDGVLVDAGPGDFVIIGEHVVHRFIGEEDNIEFQLCQFPLKILLNAGVSIKPVKKHILLSEFVKDTAFSKQITALMDALENEEAPRIVVGEKNPVLQSLLSALYFAFMRRFPEEEADKSLKKEKREFYKIAEYINEHFTEDITIQNLAQNLYMSRGKLSAIFSKYSGTSIKLYINTLRVNNTNQLLDKGENITNAAFESGFQSIRTFNDIYKNIMGITPSEYEKGKNKLS